MKSEYEFGNTLSQILTEKGLRQIDLSTKTGLPKSYISELLQSKKNPDLDTLGKICLALGISLNYFIIRSYKTSNEDEKRLLEQITPILLEIDELIYPERYSKDNSPRKPVNAGSGKKIETVKAV